MGEEEGQRRPSRSSRPEEETEDERRRQGRNCRCRQGALGEGQSGWQGHAERLTVYVGFLVNSPLILSSLATEGRNTGNWDVPGIGKTERNTTPQAQGG